MTQGVMSEQQFLGGVIMGLTACMSLRAMDLQKQSQEEQEGAQVERAILREKILCLAKALVIILEE